MMTMNSDQYKLAISNEGNNKNVSFSVWKTQPFKRSTQTKHHYHGEEQPLVFPSKIILTIYWLVGF